MSKFILAFKNNLNNEPEEDRGTILTVSGCIDEQGSGYVTQSKQMNGNYYLIDKSTSGYLRVWKHELNEYYIAFHVGLAWWIITDSPDNTYFSIRSEGSTNPYKSDGSSCKWYSINTIASNIKITATNF